MEMRFEEAEWEDLGVDVGPQGFGFLFCLFFFQFRILLGCQILLCCGFGTHLDSIGCGAESGHGGGGSGSAH